MTTGVIEKRGVRRETVALLGVLAVAAVLYCWSLGSGTVQPYYATAIHSMSQSLKAFVFAGYDPVGVVSVDKTPLAFWVQAAFAWIFGYHGWLIALVQAAEGAAAVLVLHRTVRRWASERVALLAAGLLALSPVTVAIDRNVQPDALLVLLLLLAAYCVTRAAEGGRTGWLAGAGVLAGLAFLAKMLAAWVVLPAFALAYLTAPAGWRRKVWQLALAGIVTLAVSLSWPLLVALSPNRPYVGSTNNNSIWELIFGYNGFGRVLGNDTSPLSLFGKAIGAGFGGTPGPLRLFDPAIGGQVAWLLPVALVAVLVAAGIWWRTRAGTPAQHAGWLLWGGWLVSYGLVFSFAGGVFHAYYTCALAPAIAATSAAGLAVCWRWYRAGHRAGFLWPLSIAGTAVLAFVILARTPEWLPWLRFAILAVGLIGALALLVRMAPAPIVVPTAVAGALAMIAGPLAFTLDTAASRPDVIAAGDPSAGPSTSDSTTAVRAVMGGAGALQTAYLKFMDSAPELTAGQREVLAFATARQPNAPITLAVEGGSYGADPYLLNTDAKVVTLGGYLGLDPAPTAAQLIDWVHTGRVRFVLLPEVFVRIGRAPVTASGTTQNSVVQISGRISWVARNCTPVPPARIGPDAASAGLLFDCR